MDRNLVLDELNDKVVYLDKCIRLHKLKPSHPDRKAFLFGLRRDRSYLQKYTIQRDVLLDVISIVKRKES